MAKKKKLTPTEFAKMVGGRVVPKTETGADRKVINQVPTFKSKEERQKFYMDYIPALYWVEIEGKDPDELNREDLDFFWYAFTLGIKGLEPVKLNDEKEGDDMDG
jgi:hypothetical protein